MKSRLHRARREVRERVAPLLAPLEGGPGRSPASPDVVDLLSRHLEGDIRPESCAEMEAHLAGCPRCTATCESLRETLRLCRTTPVPEIRGGLEEAIRDGIRTVLANGQRGESEIERERR